MVSNVQFFQEIGGLIGRLIFAYLAMRFVSRRSLIRVFQLPGLVVIPFTFLWAATNDLEWLRWGAGAAGLVTVAQLSFWGNYLPLVYPLHLRGTGESFAANVGGRMIGTSFAAVSAQLSGMMPGATPPTKLAYASAAVGLFVYVCGFVLSFSLPEPDPRKMQE